jgi:Fe-S cluster assembly protein SufD
MEGNMALSAHASGEHFRRDFERFIVGRAEAAGITAMRRTAFERFETLGIPNTRHEDWRFTDVSGLARSRFSIAGDAPLDAARLPADVADVCHRLVFVNGRYHHGLSRVGVLPKGVIVGSLAEAVSAHSEVVERFRERLPGLEDHAFAALNTAFHRVQ